jgi:hypothetical protein
LTKEDWDAEMKEWMMTHEWDLCDCTRTVTNAMGNGLRCIICLPTLCVKNNLQEQIEVIAHEATHAWQAIRDVIKEEFPAPEQEAYAISWITGWIFSQVFGEQVRIEVRTQ